MSHTPGPWRIWDPVRGYAHSVVAQSTSDPRYKVACADIPEGRDADGNEAYANARLIAAAPDLLTALQEAVRVIRTWHGMGMGPAEAQAWELYQASPEMKRINAAIAKTNPIPIGILNDQAVQS